MSSAMPLLNSAEIAPGLYCSKYLRDRNGAFGLQKFLCFLTFLAALVFGGLAGASPGCFLEFRNGAPSHVSVTLVWTGRCVQSLQIVNVVSSCAIPRDHTMDFLLSSHILCPSRLSKLASSNIMNLVGSFQLY